MPLVKCDAADNSTAAQSNDDAREHANTRLPIAPPQLQTKDIIPTAVAAQFETQVESSNNPPQPTDISMLPFADRKAAVGAALGLAVRSAFH
jgi:hypothetical protein